MKCRLADCHWHRLKCNFRMLESRRLTDSQVWQLHFNDDFYPQVLLVLLYKSKAPIHEERIYFKDHPGEIQKCTVVFPVCWSDSFVFLRSLAIRIDLHVCLPVIVFFMQVILFLFLVLLFYHFSFSGIYWCGSVGSFKPILIPKGVFYSTRRQPSPVFPFANSTKTDSLCIAFLNAFEKQGDSEW